MLKSQNLIWKTNSHVVRYIFGFIAHGIILVFQEFDLQSFQRTQDIRVKQKIAHAFFKKFEVEDRTHFSFPPDLTKDERKLIHQVARNRGISKHSSELDEPHRFLTITKEKDDSVQSSEDQSEEWGERDIRER